MLDNKGVLCLSVKGEPLWFTPFEGILGGITEIDGVLRVSDFWTKRGIRMVDKTGQYKRTLLDKDILKERKPFDMCYVPDAKKIYFSLYESDIICFKSL